MLRILAVLIRISLLLVASSALAKRPVVLRAQGSPVAQAYARLADEIVSIHHTARAA